jgi:sulfur carrier protein ThiS
MIKVTYRDQQWEVPDHITVRELIIRCGLDPATDLAIRDRQMVLASEVLDGDDETKLIAVITGG